MNKCELCFGHPFKYIGLKLPVNIGNEWKYLVERIKDKIRKTIKFIAFLAEKL